MEGEINLADLASKSFMPSENEVNRSLSRSWESVQTYGTTSKALQDYILEVIILKAAHSRKRLVSII